ncbi:unnamed protein product [Spirodela intermedia]|uniref:Uncharacterized protein n=2 Tax=Spirodela intermedia TaxID=51605 RepID=A0A7I8K2C5_SPIIN|nr:unnamed protein product [Spirodela intermedia]CAA6655741.1 unnamed protein product [Spirodela intermedia]CAA7391091.1 unnamed protein product [Spirodela intermedia]
MSTREVARGRLSGRFSASTKPCILLPRSRAPRWAQAQRTLTIVTVFGPAPSPRMAPNNVSASRYSPAFTYPSISALQDTTSRRGIRSNTARAATMSPHLA